MGWVHRRRDLGGVIFIHLRDREGVTQMVFHADADAGCARARQNCCAPEYVIAVEGTVELRAPETVNPNLATGEVEVVAEKIWILNESRTPPFPMEENVDVSGRRAPEVSLRGPAPPAHAAQHHPALADLLRRARSSCTRRASSKSRRRS